MRAVVAALLLASVGISSQGFSGLRVECQVESNFKRRPPEPAPEPEGSAEPAPPPAPAPFASAAREASDDAATSEAGPASSIVSMLTIDAGPD
jgi:hypothetical protein